MPTESNARTDAPKGCPTWADGCHKHGCHGACLPADQLSVEEERRRDSARKFRAAIGRAYGNRLYWGRDD